MKLEQLVTEAPLDFVRGAAGSIGQKIANTGPVRAARDVVAAGRQASQAGDQRRQLQQLVQQFTKAANIMVQRTPPQPPVQQPQQQPAQQQTQQSVAQQSKPAQAQQPGSMVPDAFRTTQRPKYTAGKYGPQLQFSSFVNMIDNDVLTEDWKDFVAGATKNLYAKANNWWRNRLAQKAGPYVGGIIRGGKEAWEAGKQASIEGDAARAREAQRTAAADVQRLGRAIKQITQNDPNLMKYVQQLVSQQSDNPQAVLQLLQRA